VSPSSTSTRDYRGCGGGLDWEHAERQFVPISQDGSEHHSSRGGEYEVGEKWITKQFIHEELDDAAMGA